MDTLINSFSELERIKDTLTFEQVRLKYGTGRSNTVTTPQGKKSYYRSGVMTEIGDIECSVWEQLVTYLIEREGETKLFDNLYEWLTDTNWAKSENERKRYALELHAARIFDKPKWVCYAKFNQKYRPEILRK